MRQDPSDAKARDLEEFLLGLTPAEAHGLARAFTLYFQIVNTAEEVFRLRRLRGHESDPAQAGAMSLERLFADLKGRGVPAERIGWRCSMRRAGGARVKRASHAKWLVLIFGVRLHQLVDMHHEIAHLGIVDGGL